MGSRGYNAGGYAYMTQVWCPNCGRSYRVGHQRLREATGPKTKPLLACQHKTTCRKRAAKRANSNPRD